MSDPVLTGRRGRAPCSTVGEVVCSQDAPNQSLECDGSEYIEFFECPGLQECRGVVGEDALACGAGGPPYARAGNPCASDDSAACSFDKSTILWCERGIWVAAQRCPPSECVSNDRVIKCANGGITLGDKCRTSAGSVTCSTDLANILACQDGIAVVSRQCGEERCTRVDTNTLGCD